MLIQITQPSVSNTQMATVSARLYIHVYITIYTCMKHGINYAKEEDTNLNNMVHTYIHS